MKRVRLELVTPHNKSEHQKVWHELMSADDRYQSFGTWQDFEWNVKNDWSQALFLAVVGKKNRRVIGCGSLHRHHSDDTASVQLGLVRDWRGKGYGAIVGRLLTRYAFENLGVQKVESTAFTTNPASIKMQKGGMKLEGTRRKTTKIAGEYVDQVLFGLLRSEWEEQVAGRG